MLKYAGVACLLCMAWATVRDKEALVVEEREAAPEVSARRVIVRGVLINILNPKLTIFFFAYLPQFVSPGEPHAVVRMAGLGGVFLPATFVVFAAYDVLAASVRRHVVGRPRVTAWRRRGFAGSFVALGAKLAVTAR
ncbi:threonine/homoserine/homoserine lactone efflux protein [Streptomyces sp. AK010]|nr:threonine/homoserine/homoserine lactone efflux protein [Streptomyces sp. AK010]